MGKSLPNQGTGKEFLAMTSKTLPMKAKTMDKLGFIKLNTHTLQRKQMKRQATDWKSIYKPGI